MDPFTAIGLAGNILTFIDIGLKLVNQTKGIYDSASNSTAENDSLSVMATRFITTMNDMQSKIPSGNLSKDEIALKALAEECSSISDELQHLLDDLKAKKANSIRSSMKATLRDWRKKKEKADLQKRLEGSRQQLNLLLSTMTRFESLERLNQLVKYGQSNEAEITSLRRNIDSLRSGLQVTFLSDEALEQIRKVVSLSDNATLKVRESCILTALRFDLMNERYDDVAEAHEKTFEWIFNSSNKDDNSDDNSRQIYSPNITSYKPMESSGARAKFTDWIKQGNGIFHVSGKPGSGKSTLMKYLCRQEETRRYLDIWAADKSLVFGEFFFWSPGTAIQKSLRGLIRSLLYSILSNAPELIPLALPKHWDATLSKVAITIGSNDISLAFTDLIRRDEVYRNHKLVFFIDGLDEFQGDHAALIREMLRWTSTRPTDVKICVSSREWPIFQEAFQIFPSFRLHELTRSDVSRIVKDRLRNNKLYEKMASPGELADFESDLVDRSDGVFLWLKLILHDIEDGLLGGDRLSQLKKKVNALPTELNDLFQHLLDSIHPFDQKEAYLILAVALKCPSRSYWPIFRLSFLEEYIENHDFALSQRLKQIEDDQMIDRLERTRKKIYGKCKGLLEIRLVQLNPQRDINRTLKESVKFTHRSIIEFLNSAQTKQNLAAELKGLDILDAMCQTFLAHIQTVIMNEDYYHNRDEEAELFMRLHSDPNGLFLVLPPPSLDYDICTLLGAFAAKDRAADSARFMAFLDKVVEVAEDLFSPQAPFQLLEINVLRWCSTNYTIRVSFPVKMGLFAALYGLKDYALHPRSIGLDCMRKHVTLPMLIMMAGRGTTMDHMVRNRISRGLNMILDAYLDLGLDPNGPSSVEGISCWHYVLLHSIGAREQDPYVPIIASFLLHGANPRFWMKFGARHRWSGSGDPSDVLIPVEFESGKERQRLPHVEEDNVSMLKLDWPLEMFLKRGQMELSCRELLGIVFPQQKADFQEAIDYILQWDNETLTNFQFQDLKERFQPTLGLWINSEASEAFSGNSNSPSLFSLKFSYGEKDYLHVIK